MTFKRHSRSSICTRSHHGHLVWVNLTKTRDLISLAYDRSILSRHWVFQICCMPTFPQKCLQGDGILNLRPWVWSFHVSLESKTNPRNFALFSTFSKASFIFKVECIILSLRWVSLNKTATVLSIDLFGRKPAQTNRRLTAATRSATRKVVSWSWAGCGLVVSLSKSLELVVSWSWPDREMVMSWLWAGCGLVVSWSWTGRELIVDWSWLGSELVMSWSWDGRELVMRWSWAGRGLVVSSSWDGRELFVSWSRTSMNLSPRFSTGQNRLVDFRPYKPFCIWAQRGLMTWPCLIFDSVA